MNVKFKHIAHFDGDPSPARCNRRTGEIFINDDMFYSHAPEHRVFILLHECGHIALNSSDEVAVDAWAFDQYVKAGYPLTESVKSLSRVLSGNSPEHSVRAAAQSQRAAIVNSKYNKNAMIKKQPPRTSIIDTASTIVTEMNPQDYHQYDYDEDFLGLGKKAKARAALRQERRHEIRMARQDRKTTRAQGSADKKVLVGESRLAKQTARQTLADQGLGFKGTGGGGVGEALSGIAAGIFGGGGSDEDYLNEAPQSNLTLYIIIGVAAAAVIGLLIYKFKKN